MIQVSVQPGGRALTWEAQRLGRSSLTRDSPPSVKREPYLFCSVRQQLCGVKHLLSLLAYGLADCGKSIITSPENTASAGDC